MRAKLRYRNSSLEGNDVFGFTILGLFLTEIAAYLQHCWWTLTLFMSDAPLTAGKAGIAIAWGFARHLAVVSLRGET